MSFIKDAQIIIPALTGLPITVYYKDAQPLKDFEKNFCFLADIQPLYTESGLLSFFEQRSDYEIYFSNDKLETSAIILKIKKQWIIVGPYVRAPWQESNAKSVLKSCNLPMDMLSPYKSYRYRLPVVSQKRAEDVAELLLNNTIGIRLQNPIQIDLSANKAEDLVHQFPEVYSDFSQVNRRYTLENQLKDAIREGNVIQAFHILESNQDLRSGIYFLSDSTSDKIASAFAIRVLVRQAAVEAGLTPIYVDALSQEYAQKMHQATSESQLRDLMRQYLMAFCYAINENRKNDYSPYVKRALQYIELQLNQPITVDELCKLNNITRPYFSQLFHKETGKTVKQYIMQARCNRAADLLRNSNMPIQEISRYVGYTDTNYFARIFKSVMNTTPQEYRRSKRSHQSE
jgi:YesN/AraC family two-component response regulator